MKKWEVIKEAVSECKQYKIVLAFNGLVYIASVAELDEYGEQYETKLNASCKDINVVIDEYNYFKDYYNVA